MVERLGQVIYWLGCACAGVALLFGWFYANTAAAERESTEIGWPFLGIFAAIALVVWLVGRAVLYVLAGR